MFSQPEGGPGDPEMEIQQGTVLLGPPESLRAFKEEMGGNEEEHHHSQQVKGPISQDPEFEGVALVDVKRRNSALPMTNKEMAVVLLRLFQSMTISGPSMVQQPSVEELQVVPISKDPMIQQPPVEDGQVMTVSEVPMIQQPSAEEGQVVLQPQADQIDDAGREGEGCEDLGTQKPTLKRGRKSAFGSHLCVCKFCLRKPETIDKQIKKIERVKLQASRKKFVGLKKEPADEVKFGSESGYSSGQSSPLSPVLSPYNGNVIGQENKDSSSGTTFFGNGGGSANLESQVPPTLANPVKHGKVKKPMNSYMIFLKEVRVGVKKEYNLISNAEVNQIVGEMWRNLDGDTKDAYSKRAAQERANHHAMYPDFSYTCTRRKRRPRPQSEKGKLTRPDLKAIVKAEVKKIEGRCRATFGIYRQQLWCNACRMKKKCTGVVLPNSNKSDSENNLLTKMLPKTEPETNKMSPAVAMPAENEMSPAVVSLFNSEPKLENLKVEVKWSAQEMPDSEFVKLIEPKEEQSLEEMANFLNTVPVPEGFENENIFTLEETLEAFNFNTFSDPVLSNNLFQDYPNFDYFFP